MMKVLIEKDNQVLNPEYIDPDSFILMRELDNVDLKVNHLKLYLKTSLIELYPNNDIELINAAIDRIDLSIFVRGICEGNSSIKILLSKNVVFELARVGISIPLSKISSLLNISREIKED